MRYLLEPTCDVGMVYHREELLVRTTHVVPVCFSHVNIDQGLVLGGRHVMRCDWEIERFGRLFALLVVSAVVLLCRTRRNGLRRKLVIPKPAVSVTGCRTRGEDTSEEEKRDNSRRDLL